MMFLHRLFDDEAFSFMLSTSYNKTQKSNVFDCVVHGVIIDRCITFNSDLAKPLFKFGHG